MDGCPMVINNERWNEMKTWDKLSLAADQRFVDQMTWRELEVFILSHPEPYVDAGRWINAVMYARLLLEAYDDLI